MAGITQQDVLIIKQIYDNKEALVKINQTVKAVQDAHQKMLPASMRGNSTLLNPKVIQKAINDVEYNKKQAHQAEMRRIKDIRGRMIEIQRGILQGGLSIMFFGMMMKNFFQDIAISSLTTFNKLNADTMAANNTMNRLSAAIEGVRYAIGDAISSALEPMEGTLMNIIDKVIDFVDTHPKLITWGLAIGLIVGTVMMLVGQISLLIIGLAATKLAFAGAGAAGVASGTATSASWMLVAGKIALVIGLFLSVFKLLQNDKTFVNFFSNIIVLIAKSLASGLWAMNAFVTTLKNSVIIAFKALVYGIKWVFQEGINLVINGINVLIRGYNNIAGKLGLKSIGQIGKVDFTKGGLDISTETEAIKNAWSKEEFNKWMAAAENVGNMFKQGISQLSIFDKNKNKQEELINKEMIVADAQLESANLMSIAANTIINNKIQPSSGSANASYQNEQIFYGFSTQM